MGADNQGVQSMTRPIYFAAAISIGASPVLAAPPIVVFPDVAVERVSYADLDLASSDGRTMLVGRIRAAADRVCDVGGNPNLAEYSLRSGCFAAAVGSGERQMDQAIASRGIADSTATAALTISAKQR